MSHSSSAYSNEPDHTRTEKRKAEGDIADSGPKRRRRCDPNKTTTKQSLERSPESDPNKRQQSEKRKAESHKEERRAKRRRSRSPERPVRAAQEVIDISSRVSSDSRFVLSNDNNQLDCGDNLSPEEEKIYQMSSKANTKRDHFNNTYTQLEPIGSGGFGSVFAGIRGNQHCNGQTYFVALEVAYMLKTEGLPGEVRRSATVSLLDWYYLDDQLVLVMERPPFAMDLNKYLKTVKGGYLQEHQAMSVLKQLVDASIDIHSKGIFHRDLKPENLLMDTEHKEHKLLVIDFGCATFSTENTFETFCGTLEYAPPEWFTKGEYQARPTTVWQIGAIFYSMLKGHRVFKTQNFTRGRIKINPKLSKRCKQLLRMCLVKKPTERATLEELKICLNNMQPQPSV
ncbi:serine/threonine-protein kinase pim-2-like [Parambassis ranga]|uniref:non-specific serine/threonine protein kinase n=1 Tax=Parambassis ranga TaxID=210632 RepID=A0A6P7JG66_9TELE|nr:serine/threonine-protein kinase pim-2-like [Parambassis ranga]